MAPKVVVLSGGYAFERVRNLLNGMTHVPSDYNSYGQVMVQLMVNNYGQSPQQQEELLGRYLQRFVLPDQPDPDIDRNIMLEALHYGARQFRVAWDTQVPGMSCQGYQFCRWLGADLVLQRHDTL